MNVIVDKRALIGAIIESLNEKDEDTAEFERISVDENEPIKPVEMMSTQLAEEMPPVDDPEFIPHSIDQLARSAYVISQEVPQSEVEYFYRKLHNLLDSALDREAEKEMQIENLRSFVSNLLEGNEEQDALLKTAAQNIMQKTSDWQSEADRLSGEKAFQDVSPEDISYMLIDFVDMDTGPETTEVSSSDEEAVDFDEEEYEKDYQTASSIVKTQPENLSPESLARNIVNLILKKDIHRVVLKDPETGETQMVPVVMINPKTGDFELSARAMRVLASENYAFEVIKKAREFSDIESLWRHLAKKASPEGASEREIENMSQLWVYSNLVDMLGKEGNPVTSELAAEMYSNQIADTIGKYGEEVVEQLNKMADEVETKTEDVTAQIGRGSDALSIVVPPDEMAAALRMVADQRLERPRRGRPKMYGDFEPREAMTSEMRKKIRAERREAELELEYEPGKLHLSPKALRAMMDKIATKLNTSLGNVRNIIYDDLIEYGLPVEDLRKMIQVDKMPGGRERIPFTYDPLRIQAVEEIVEKLYGMYSKGMKAYLKREIEEGDEELSGKAKALDNLFFGPRGYYQPGLDGYLKLQGQVGGFDEDPEYIDSQKFRVKRKAYDFVMEFIDQMARQWVDPETEEYKKAKGGGVRAFLNSLVSDEVFSDLNSRANIGDILDKELASIEKSFDEDTLNDIIGNVFDKAPKRTTQYIKRVKKEMGSK